jgi:RHS repeat-associated protein
LQAEIENTCPDLNYNQRQIKHYRFRLIFALYYGCGLRLKHTEGVEPVENITTWVFEEGSFRPAAKLTKDKKYSIVTDYLGTPAQMYDEKGQVVWETHLDIYGKVRTFAGRSLSDCPFRYQGQYQDAETGLYYNRFRYYDPSIGAYLSQDPIGPLGGSKLYSYVCDPNIWIDEFGLCSKAGTGKRYEVGIHEDLKIKGSGIGLDSHHVGQKALMGKFISGYDLEKAPAILVPAEGHIRKKPGVGIVSRSSSEITNVRDLVARDIKELRRVYPDIPNEKLNELIDLNKKMYPEAFEKKSTHKH